MKSERGPESRLEDRLRIELTEAVGLTVIVVALPMLVFMRRRLRGAVATVWMPVSYAFVSAATVSTIAEGVGGVVGGWFNLLEHGSLLAAGVAAVVAVTKIRASAREAVKRS